MNHEYFLISRKRNEIYLIIDKIIANGIREAEKFFLSRNVKKKDEEFIIVKSERWIQ